jgi:hypothetical protein
MKKKQVSPPPPSAAPDITTGAYLPTHFHPKDTPRGVVMRMDTGYGACPNTERGTVLINVCGLVLEMMPDKALMFADMIRHAAVYVSTNHQALSSAPVPP